jgi:DNA-binding MarR family transcriptional regulator
MKHSCYCDNLRVAARKVSALYDDALAPFGVNIAQYSLLRKIERLGEPSLTELGRIAELDRSTIGRNVRVLEKDGLVENARGEDQREALVRLTRRGAELLKRAKPAWDKCQRALEERLGAQMRALDTLVETL